MSDKPVKERKLNQRQELFCQMYAKCLNASQAAEEAGYTGTKGEIGYQLLQKSPITKRIKELRKGAVEKVHVEASMILNELMKMATVDLGDLYNTDGSLKSIHDIPKHVRQCIKSIDTYKDFTEGVEIGETKKIVLWSKEKALELLGKYQGMWIDKTQNTNLNLNVDIDVESEEFKKIKAALTTETNSPIDITPIKIKATDASS